MPSRVRLNLFVVLAICVAAFCCGMSTSRAAVWQWSVPVTGGIDHAGPATAYLWIPVNCHKVRGVVIGQNNMEEDMILENPKFRATLAGLDFAEVWVSPAFDGRFEFDKGTGDVLTAFMTDLGKVSGYQELSFDPIIPIGHSAEASWPYYFAAWDPDRALAAISVSGQWPYFRDKIFAPDIWGTLNIDYIPCLETMGEYEGADGWANEGVNERKAHPLLPLSMAAGPAQSHFIAADAKIDYLCLYIQKAVDYRLPKDWTVNAAPKLIPIDPTKTGWLVDRWRKNSTPTAPPAPVGEYKGDPTQAFWYFDAEMAKATETYEAAYNGKKVDLLAFVNPDGTLAPQTNSHLQVYPKFVPDADGITFHLSTTFYDTVPGESPRPTGWTGLPVGSPVGHAAGGGPIVIRRIQGPFEKIDDTTFAVNMEHGLGSELNRYDLVFAATHPGDDDYRPAVQQAQITIPARLTNGADQHITFPVVPNQKLGATSVQLAAISDAGVPVHYFVESGPAELTGDNTLTFTPLPPSAKFPVAVTVVAWQYGHAAPPALKSADNVALVFYIVAPHGTAPAPAIVNLVRTPVVVPAPASAPTATPLTPAVQTNSQPTISFNLCSKLGMSPGDLGGAESRVGNWNSIQFGSGGSAGTISAAIDKDGKPVPGLTATVTGGDAEYHIFDASGDSSASNNDTRLFNGVFDQWDGGPASVSVTGIPYAHYNVFFYRSDDGGTRAGKFTIGSTTLYIRGGSGNPTGDGKGYVRSTSTALGTGGSITSGNYVEFENLSGATLNATFAAVNAGDSVQRCKVVGFQIVAAK